MTDDNKKETMKVFEMLVSFTRSELALLRVKAETPEQAEKLVRDNLNEQVKSLEINYTKEVNEDDPLPYGFTEIDPDDAVDNTVNPTAKPTVH